MTGFTPQSAAWSAIIPLNLENLNTSLYQDSFFIGMAFGDFTIRTDQAVVRISQ